MRVAQFVHRYPPAFGGAEAWTERLSRYLVGQGHQVTVWTTTAIDLSAFTRAGCQEVAPGTDVVDGVTVRRYRPEFRFPGRRPILKALSQFPGNTWRAMTQHWAPISTRMWRDAAHETNVDVVHAIAFPYASIIRSAMRLARTAKTPFVVTPFLHLGDLDDPNDAIRRAYMMPHLVAILRHADRVLVQTPTEARAVEGLGIPLHRIVLQGLGVDPAECTSGNRTEARQSWGVCDSEIVVGHLANLSMEKGSPDVICAVEEVREQSLPVRVVLAGPEMPSFTQFWKYSGPESWITRLGPLSDQGRRAFFAGIDIFTLPSRLDSFGLVFLEAWANGLPVIGYRAGGVIDVIRHEQDGLLVKCGDIDGLTAAVRRLATNSTEREGLGRAGQERTATDFCWEDKLRIARDAITNWPGRQ